MNTLQAVGGVVLCIIIVTLAATAAASSDRPIGPRYTDQTTSRTSLILEAVVLIPFFGLLLAAFLA